MAPSKADRKSMWSGVRWLIGVLVLGNFIALLFGAPPELLTARVRGAFSLYVLIYAYAGIISIIHLLFATVLLGIPARLLGR